MNLSAFCPANNARLKTAMRRPKFSRITRCGNHRAFLNDQGDGVKLTVDLKVWGHGKGQEKVGQGIFYEFIRSEEFFEPNPKRYTIGEVELGVNYVMILSTNAGLWGYNLGDTVQFTSLMPYRLIVTGRIKHFISAFGEHIIAKEVESALLNATQHFTLHISEFTVAPFVASNKGEASRHEWFIEWKVRPSISLNQIEQVIEASLMEQNSYYKELIEGAILKPLKIVSIREGGMRAYMRSNGKLGGQNKMIRLSNNRKIADFLIQNAWVETTEP